MDEIKKTKYAYDAMNSCLSVQLFNCVYIDDEIATILKNLTFIGKKFLHLTEVVFKVYRN